MLKALLKSLPGIRRMAQCCDLATETNALAMQCRLLDQARYREELLERDRYKDARRLNRFEGQVFSQTGIDGLLTEVFRRIGVADRTFVEIGTESGLETNTTFLLWQGWSGWWIEGNPPHVAQARLTFQSVIAANRLCVHHRFVTAENVEAVFDEAGVPHNPDLLSLDIDRNTYWVLKSVRRRPRVIVVEYNASIPPSVEWVVEYNSKKTWNSTTYFGASLKSYEVLGREMGYQLVGCDLAGINAVLVRNDLTHDRFVDIATAENLYEPPRYVLVGRPGFPACFSD